MSNKKIVNPTAAAVSFWSMSTADIPRLPENIHVLFQTTTRDSIPTPGLLRHEPFPTLSFQSVFLTYSDELIALGVCLARVKRVLLHTFGARSRYSTHFPIGVAISGGNLYDRSDHGSDPSSRVTRLLIVPSSSVYQLFSSVRPSDPV